MQLLQTDVLVQKKPSSGEYYKVVLVIGYMYDSNGKFIGFDYHWYRENPDGTWSHKPGHGEVTNLDSSGKVITDPTKANRYYRYNDGSVTNYNYVVGTYYVGGGLIE